MRSPSSAEVRRVAASSRIEAALLRPSVRETSQDRAKFPEKARWIVEV